MKGMWLAAMAACALMGCSEADAVAAAGEGDTASPTDTLGDLGDGTLDDVAPSDAVVPVPECTSHDECDDGVECTGDLCTIEGQCSHDLADEICLIDGACVATGDVNPANDCEMCDSAIMLDAWSARPEAACDDGNPCTQNDTCNKNTCEGTLVTPCCGDGEIEGDETCDGDCPTACPDGDACTSDTITGTPEACDVICVHDAILACEGGDGCCPDGCAAGDDADCVDASLCGNDVLDEGEICDGDCPSSCDDGDPCTVDLLSGSAATCDAQCIIEETITLCAMTVDGCCPSACDATTDGDCSATCGNGVVEAGELCDGDCPVSCSDDDACTVESLIGSAVTCDAQCVTDETISACVSDDSCCPAACDDSTDNDCPSLCGNGVVDAGETCDTFCPQSCSSSNACTPMTVTGSSLTCDAECVVSETITSCINGDGCCPGACNEGNDDDCDPAQTCVIDIVVQCIDNPNYSAIAKISTSSPPGVMTWSYPPNNTPLENWCATDNGDPGQHLEASSGCVTATYETGLCVMPEPLSCETTLCYECP